MAVRFELASSRGEGHKDRALYHQAMHALAVKRPRKRYMNLRDEG
jgi:hypothetical protein